MQFAMQQASMEDFGQGKPNENELTCEISSV
jgi:hypothetical protein